MKPQKTTPAIQRGPYQNEFRAEWGEFALSLLAQGKSYRKIAQIITKHRGKPVSHMAIHRWAKTQLVGQG